MEAKEKAKQLIDKFKPLVTTWDCYWDIPRNENLVKQDAKKCASIAVDEIMQEVTIGRKLEWINERKEGKEYIEYWEQVKAEIELV